MATTINGRADQVSGYANGDNSYLNENGLYCSGHSVLLNGHNRLSDDKVGEIGSMLFNPEISKSAKEAVLMILAHHPKTCAIKLLEGYNKNPDKELKYFAEIALWECRTWNK